MSEPTFSSSSNRSRTQDIERNGRVVIALRTSVTDSIPETVIQSASGSLYMTGSMSVARELAAAINQSADWVESGKPVPLVKPTPPTPDDTKSKTTNIEWIGFLLMWGGACAVAGAAVGKVLL